MHETDTSSLANKYPDLTAAHAGDILAVEDFRGDLCAVVKPEAIRALVQFVKTSLGFEMLMDVIGLDYQIYVPEQRDRFAVVYIFYSLTRNEHFRLKVYLPEDQPEVDSVHDLYASANWFEREAWDLFGIKFRGHPNLIRILCHGDFEGHPLRKDYPSDQYQRLKAAAPGSEF